MSRDALSVSIPSMSTIEKEDESDGHNQHQWNDNPQYIHRRTFNLEYRLRNRTSKFHSTVFQNVQKIFFILEWTIHHRFFASQLLSIHLTRLERQLLRHWMIFSSVMW
jgi:hypothetical protein